MAAKREQTKSWRVAPHPQRRSSEWWDYARVSYSAPEPVRPLLIEMPFDELRVTEADAAAIEQWAASLPGWQGDQPDSAKALIIEPAKG